MRQTAVDLLPSTLLPAPTGHDEREYNQNGGSIKQPVEPRGTAAAQPRHRREDSQGERAPPETATQAHPAAEAREQQPAQEGREQTGEPHLQVLGTEPSAANDGVAHHLGARGKKPEHVDLQA